MANNYVQFSEVLPQLTSREEAWLKEQLEWIEGDMNPLGARFLLDYPDYDPDYGEIGFEYGFCTDQEVDGWGRHLWFYAEEGGDPGQVAFLVQKFLKQFRPDGCWWLTYAATCSKPRAGEFGGGAAFVTANAIHWENAYEFVEGQEKLFQAGQSMAKRFEAAGVPPEQLDELAHEAAASQAASINNGGLAAQIEYLIAHLGIEELEKLLAGKGDS